jgi:YegS/Rv2252/BmrU family lipid kinase
MVARYAAVNQPLPRTAVLIVNAKSRKGQATFRQARALLEGAGIMLTEAHALRDPTKLKPTIQAAVAKGAPMIIIGGGDGSLSCAVDYVVGRDCVFALLPLGTANSFARTLGIPLDLEGAVQVIANGQRRRIDLGMIDKDYYANCAAIGISPLIAQTVPHRLKAWGGRAGYLLWAVIQFFRFHSFQLTVENDGKVESIKALEVRIANGSYHGGTELVDDAEVDSGRIVVQAVIGNARRSLAWSWLLSVLRLEARKSTTVEFQGRALRISTNPPLPISIDGEVLAKTPVTARVARAVIEVAAPST